MDKILTFDCYGTLLNTSPLYDFVGKLAENNKLSAQSHDPRQSRGLEEALEGHRTGKPLKRH